MRTSRITSLLASSVLSCLGFCLKHGTELSPLLITAESSSNRKPLSEYQGPFLFPPLCSLHPGAPNEPPHGTDEGHPGSTALCLQHTTRRQDQGLKARGAGPKTPSLISGAARVSGIEYLNRTEPRRKGTAAALQRSELPPPCPQQ